jgi:hypothetical protein
MASDVVSGASSEGGEEFGSHKNLFFEILKK